jgi:hypothetical protein
MGDDARFCLARETRLAAERALLDIDDPLDAFPVPFVGRGFHRLIARRRADVTVWRRSLDDGPLFLVSENFGSAAEEKRRRVSKKEERK